MRSRSVVVAVMLIGACRQQPEQSALESRLAAVEARLAKIEASATSSRLPTAASAPHSNAVAAPNADDTWQIVSVDSRITEANSSWSKYAWQLVLRNDSSVPQVFDATIEFKDADGFVVEDDTEYKLTVPARAEETFAGYDLVNADVVGKIRSTSAKVKKHS